MNRAQRNVLFVALGATCAVAALAINFAVSGHSDGGGWFVYEPSNGQTDTFFSSGVDTWLTIRSAVVWLLAIALGRGSHGGSVGTATTLIVRPTDPGCDRGRPGGLVADPSRAWLRSRRPS